MIKRLHALPALAAFLALLPAAVRADAFADTDGDGLSDAFETAAGLNPASGLVADLAAWWRFSAVADGVVADASGSARPLSVLEPSAAVRTACAPAAAVHVAGSSPLLVEVPPFGTAIAIGANLPSGADASLAASLPALPELTLAFWFHSTALAGPSHLATLGNVALALSGSSLSATVGGQTLAAASPVPAGQWTHLALSVSGEAAMLYVNGAPAATCPAPADPAGDGRLLAGSRPGALFVGEFADFRVYASALSPDEIGDLLDAYADLDGDGLPNILEQALGTNPASPDTDGDGLPDAWEHDHGLDPLLAADAARDADGDGLPNRREFSLGTDPNAADTDGDGMPDAWEAQYALDPLDPADAALDPDGDGFTNLREFRLGRDPRAPAVASATPLVFISSPAFRRAAP